MSGEALSRLAVEARFRGEADGETRLKLPEEWAGASELWRHLEGLEVEGAQSVAKDGEAWRVIRHTPGAALTVRYRVRSAYDADPPGDYDKGRPTVRPTWFLAYGEGLFVQPEGRSKAPARFAWGPLPRGWRVASDLDHIAAGAPATVYDIDESVAMGAPDLTLIEREVDGAPLRVAVLGRWSFTAEAFADRLTGIMRATHAFWGDRGRPFLVPLAPLTGGGEGSYSSHGTGRTDAFALSSTTNQPLDAFLFLLAHEYGHSWIDRQLGQAPETDEALEYWFREGFSDYQAARVLVRGGVWTLDDFVADLNTVLTRNARSSARAAPNSAIPAGFWSDSAMGQLPYDRGRLLALALDEQLRGAGRAGGLDATLRAQRLRARAGGAATPAALFPAVLRETTGFDAAPLLARHVEAGEPVVLPARLYGCLTVENQAEPIFADGFDRTATEAAGNVFKGVEPSSPAYAAGLRDGMQWLGNAAKADTPGAIAYRVRDGERERVIAYVRAKSGERPRQAVAVAEGLTAEQRAACARAVAGG
jgi:predicted metalloprotease with PDZ domain